MIDIAINIGILLGIWAFGCLFTLGCRTRHTPKSEPYDIASSVAWPIYWAVWWPMFLGMLFGSIEKRIVKWMDAKR